MADLKVQRLDDCLQLEGDINYGTVSRALNFNLFSVENVSNGKVCVSFSKVNSADSSALALMIHWLRAAKQKKIDLQFSHVPTKLIALAEMSNLESILQLS